MHAEQTYRQEREAGCGGRSPHLMREKERQAGVLSALGTAVGSLLPQASLDPAACPT